MPKKIGSVSIQIGGDNRAALLGRLLTLRFGSLKELGEARWSLLQQARMGLGRGEDVLWHRLPCMAVNGPGTVVHTKQMRGLNIRQPQLRTQFKKPRVAGLRLDRCDAAIGKALRPLLAGRLGCHGTPVCAIGQTLAPSDKKDRHAHASTQAWQSRRLVAFGHRYPGRPTVALTVFI